ncbi:Holliday junction resolvase RuvX [Thiomicrospira sp. WB1]|uniref:Holliday junction resolvase RuvX n=1 Tax=Thiomicrospira sp. WB1 TaxID=1685380 RepID=UPI000746A9C8|nr:Holliday junction resolvase RuvX [Thiomicrospira sp. WB1]KUJ73081.1 crossover junction endodeoxyribonuclease RuvA [Thiomicrospira sp. WB1]
MTDPAGMQGRVIGFDFGLRRIGVAIGNTLTATASAESIVQSRDGRPDWDAISALFDQWQPVAIVVGLPLRLDGTDQPLTQPARKFGQRLGGRYHRPVFYMEEQLSSIEAEKRAPEAEHHDDLAAEIILSNWLETLK